MFYRPQMASNHDPALVTLFHSTLEHTLDNFLRFSIFWGEALFGPVEPTPYSSNNPAYYWVFLTHHLRFHGARTECHVIQGYTGSGKYKQQVLWWLYWLCLLAALFLSF